MALVTFFALASSWLNWGFSLIFSAVLAREVARRVRGVDYRALAAASFLGLGSIWAQGLSGSAALQMASPGALQPQIREIVDHVESTVELEALVRSIKATFENYVKLNKKIPPEMIMSVASITDPARLADTIVAHLGIKLEDKQTLLETVQPGERLEKVLGDLPMVGGYLERGVDGAKAAVREILPPKRVIWTLRYSRSNRSRVEASRGNVSRSHMPQAGRMHRSTSPRSSRPSARI